MIAIGNKEYELGSHPVTGIGLSWNEEEVNYAISGSVSKLIFDEEGKQLLQSFLEGVADTDFESQKIEEILNKKNDSLEDWRVGEAIAESYLIHHRKCIFPWPDSRDERKSGSSLPGADLVGFYLEGDKVYFAFGEVKTSSQAFYPPNAVYGRSGMHQQIENLKEIKSIRDDLFKYLAYRAINASWESHFKAAANEYLQSSTKIRIFGLLIRDVQPHEGDLKNRVKKISQSCPQDMQIEFLAIYLPQGSISSLSEKVLSNKNRGAL